MYRPYRPLGTALTIFLALACQLGGAGCARARRSTAPRSTVDPEQEAALQVAIKQSAEKVRQYERLELTIEIGGVQLENPFDPGEIDLAGVFRTPSGKTIAVPAFYWLPYQRSRGAGGEEVLTRAGEGAFKKQCFKVRFAGREVGEHSYEVVAREDSGERKLGSGRFEVTPSDRKEQRSKGYVRISASSPLYFELDSGGSYFAIGENMCWPGEGGTYDYDKWMAKLAEHGGNHIRLWLINDWNKLGLENRKQTAEGDEREQCSNGLGRYTQQAAWRVDYVIEMGERLGVRALMCIDSFNSVDSRGRHGNWGHSAYNAENGGPCKEPAEFFVSPEARRLFKQRLRYLVARWGYSTSVLAWEFWNEVDLATGYESRAVAGWHKEMGEYLRSIDPWEHLITTSYSRTAGDAEVDGLPEMEFLQSHNYGARDIAGMVNDWSRRQIEKYGKAYYLGEYGADVRGEVEDKEGVQLHNGLWAGMLSGCAGTAMLWYWDWVEERDLYHEFGPVAAFAADVDWAREGYRPVRVAGVCYAGGAKPGAYGTLTLDPTGESWEDGSAFLRPQTLWAGRDGEVRNRESLGGVLHGRSKPKWRNPVTFEANYPKAGRFEVVTGEVSRYGGARLVIYVDGREKVMEDLTAGRRGAASTYGVAVGAGRHQIVVENQGQDWFRASYRLVGYLEAPNLRVLALGNGRSALVWVQNKEHTWWNATRGEVTPVGAAEITLGGFEPGRYEVEQWDTYTGKAQRSKVTSKDGTVTLVTPAGLSKDVAYKVRRAKP